MGCDIHCYVEYKYKAIDHWNSFGSEIRLDRNYTLFAKLAGVRNYGKVKPVAERRGMPDDASYEARYANLLFVTTSPGEEYITPERAAKWVADGISKYVGNDNSWVTHPDWHSHSWLTTQEFAQAIEGSGEPQYEVLLETLRAFETRGYEARVVFWFDN